MEAIAKEAGASTKTVYARYANKAEVVGALNLRLGDRIAAARAASAPAPQAMDPRSALLSLGQTQAHIYDSDEVVGLIRGCQSGQGIGGSRPRRARSEDRGELAGRDLAGRW